jgi:glyoxylase-like metal-dependent hydrolase (beta-lactamase superfamily II)
MNKPKIIPLDLNFQNTPGVIAAYLLPHTHGAALIESGPGSTQHTLTQQLQEHGYQLSDLTDVFLTHIHLDHGGAAGWLAQHGARIHVHPFGAPHLIDPTKLLASAARIYGDQMQRLWGDFLAVPADKLHILADGEMVAVENLRLLPLDTPGHANHHMAFLYEGVCFSGDVGGVRMGGLPYVRAPMPPPDLNLELWRQSIHKIAAQDFHSIAPTHYGIYTDPQRHLKALSDYIDLAEAWMSARLPAQPTSQELRVEYDAWLNDMADAESLEGWARTAYELANPGFMAVEGMLRYWRKFRTPQQA